MSTDRSSRELDAPVRTSLTAIVAGTLLVALALASAGTAPKSTSTAWCMIAGCALLVSGCVVLGMRRSRISRRLSTAVGLFVLADILLGFGVPALLPPASAGSRLVLGLPLGAAIEVYGVGLLPIVVLPVIFALRFRADGLDAASIEQLRARCAALRAAGPPL